MLLNNVPATDFVQRDLDDADLCDVMVVYLPKLSAAPVWSCLYAKRKGKKVIIVSDLECLSPWIVVHSDVIVRRFEDLGDALAKLVVDSFGQNFY